MCCELRNSLEREAKRQVVRGAGKMRGLRRGSCPGDFPPALQQHPTAATSAGSSSSAKPHNSPCEQRRTLSWKNQEPAGSAMPTHMEGEAPHSVV